MQVNMVHIFISFVDACEKCSVVEQTSGLVLDVKRLTPHTWACHRHAILVPLYLDFAGANVCSHQGGTALTWVFAEVENDTSATVLLRPHYQTKFVLAFKVLV